MKDVKCCIFDLDGVIVDTAKYHYLAWKSLANELGFNFTEEHNEALKGVSRMRSLDTLLEVGAMSTTFVQSEKELMAEVKNNRYVEYIVKMGREELLPGVENFLKDLRKSGIKIALGSASKNAPLILDRLGITHLFDAVVDGTMVSAAKPDPEVFLRGAELVEVAPSECIVFEDAAAGVEAAKRAGMRCVGVGSIDQLGDADMVIDGFESFKLENFKSNIWLTNILRSTSGRSSSHFQLIE